MQGDYYGEWDEYAAQWLRNLIAAGLIPPGEVDTRSIKDVRPDDLKGFRQCHFFAGIGGWPLALKFAGWGDRPVWTGSCPCQPFSAAGKQQGEADERHLWPDFFRLIRECRPAVVVGEQVASKLGREWLSGVRADLETLGYAVGAADLCAAGSGAPHIRQRLFWVADRDGGRQSQLAERDSEPLGRIEAPCGDDAERRRAADGMADASASGRRTLQWPGEAREHATLEPDGLGEAGALGRMADADVSRAQRLARNDGQAARLQEVERSEQRAALPERSGAACGLGDADDTRSQGRLDGPGEGGSADQRAVGPTGLAGFWSRYDVVHCTDGKARRVGSGLFPLAHGASQRVGRLRAYGNAIVPQVAAEFIRAYLACRP